jgi:hypothetical protein
MTLIPASPVRSSPFCWTLTVAEVPELIRRGDLNERCSVRPGCDEKGRKVVEVARWQADTIRHPARAVASKAWLRTGQGIWS